MQSNTTLPVVVIADPFGGAPARLVTEANASIASIIEGAGDRLHWARDHLRVYQNGVEMLPGAWVNLVPIGGDHVLIAPIPQYYTILYIASYLKAAFSSWSAFSAAASTVAKYAALVTTAVNIVSGLLGGGGSKSTYGISGAGNTAMPDQVCPAVFGKRRVVPPLAATTWTQAVGDDVHLCMLVQWHVDRCRVSDIRIGETPIEKFDGIEIQHRLSPSDLFPTLYNRIVREDTYGSLQLVHDNGWVQRRTQVDTTEIGIDLAWPAGLAWNGKDEARCDVAIQYRAVGASNWITAPVGGGLGHGVDGSIKILETKAQSFRRNFSWTVPKGEYDVQILRTWPDAGDGYPRLQDQVFWVCMRSFGEGLPVIGDNFALTALRIKATNQLNGQIDNLNGIVEAMVPKWDGEQFGNYGVSSNPGELLNWLANGPANAKPLTDRFNVSGVGAFAELCAAKSWKCDYILDSDMSVLNAMELVGASGHALGIGWEDGLLSVSVDNEREAPAQVFSGRNVKNFRGTITFPDKLHGVIVSFFDAASGYQQHTRIVYAEGYNAATATLFERIDAPTKTDAAEAYVVGWRYLAARKLRPEVYEFDTDLEGLVVHFGSRADIAHTRMAVGVRGARVNSLITREDGAVTGLVLDEIVPMVAGTSYVLRAQRGSSVGLFAIVTAPGETNTLTLKNPAPAANAPLPGNPCVFGVEGKETLPALVVGIATAEDKTSHLTCIPYVEALLADGGDIPAWDPKITPRAMAEPITTGHVTPTVRRAVDDTNLARLATDPVPDGYITNDKIADATFDPVAKFIAGMDAIKIVSGSVLPTTKITNTIFLLGTSKLYRWNATTGAYTTAVDTSDLTGSIVAAQIADASLTTAKFAADIEPVTIVTGSTVPTTKSTSTIFLTGPGKLFRWVAAVGYLASVSTTDLSGTITSAQIADAALTTAKFAAGIEPVTIVSSGSLPTTKSTSTIVYNNKLYRWDATVGAYVASVATTDLSGTIATGQIADGAVTAAKIAAGTITATQLASSLSVPTVVSSLPSSGGEGQLVVLTTDGKLYRYHSGAWTAAVPSLDITGAITGTQIADAALTTAKFAAGIEPVTIVTSGALPTTKSTSTIVYNNKLYRWDTAAGAYVASVATTDLAGTIATGQIADAAITAAKIAAGTITATQLASSLSVPTVVPSLPAGAEGQLVVLTTDGKLYRYHSGAWSAAVATTDLSGTITGSQIASGTVTGSNLAASTITATQIAAAAVDATKFASGIEPVSIVTGALPATKLTTTIYCNGQLYRWNGSAYICTTDAVNITGTITGSQIAASTVNAANIASGAVGTAQMAGSSVTFAKMFVKGVPGAALNPDPNCQDVTAWVGNYVRGSNLTAVTDAAAPGGTAIEASVQNQVLCDPFAIDPAKNYNLRTSVKQVSGSSTMYLAVVFYDATGTIVYPNPSGSWGTGSYDYWAITGSTGPAIWTEYSISIGPNESYPIPTTAKTVALGFLLNYAGTGVQRFANVRLVEKVSSPLLVDGSIISAKIADAALTTAKFAAGITPVEIVALLPAVGNFQGRTALLTTDNKLYRYTGSAWTKVVDGADLSALSVIGSAIASSTITGSNIASSTITATQLAAGAVTANQIASAAIDATKFASGIEPVTIITGSLPTTKSTTTIAYNGDIYRWSGSAYIKTVQTTDLSGTIAGAQIAASTITAAKLSIAAIDASGNVASGAIGTLQLAAQAVTAAKLLVAAIDTSGNVASGAVGTSQIASGAVTGSQIASATVTGSNIASGTVGTGNITDGALTAPKFASGIGPVTTVTGSLPSTKSTDVIVYGGDLYRWNGSAYVKTVLAADLSGLIVGSQITASTITAAKLSIAAIDSSGNVASGAVGTLQLATAAVTSAKTNLAAIDNSSGNLNANTVSATQIVSASITSLQIAAGTITGANIAAGTVTASNIASQTITANQISAGAIGATQLAANSVAAANIIAGAIISSNIAASTITGVNIAAGTLTATNIAANTITAGQIAAGTITGSNLVAGTITATQIASSTIVASKIAAGTITATQIAAATITGANLVAGTITATQIAASTITANQVAAGAIGATQLAANSVAASNIIAGAIVSGNIAAATITGSNIAAGTITAANIAADTITAGQIAAGAVTAAELAAGSVTASKVAIVGNNQILDPQFSDPSYWYAPYTTQISSDATACSALKATKCASTGSIAGLPANYQSYITVQNLSLTGGTPIRISFDTYVTAGFTGFLLVLMNCFDGQGNAMGTLTVNGPNYNAVAATSATTAHWSGIFTPPTGAMKGALFLYLSCSSTLNNSGTGYWGNPSVINAADGSLIVDGSVTATKIASNTITATQIAAATITGSNIAAGTIAATNLVANTITAGQIASGAIGTSQLAAGAVTADQISVGTITASQVAGATITGGKIASATITATNIASQTVTATQIAANTITSAQIAANTITAGQIAAGAITTTQIAANTITASNLAAATITAGQIAAGAIGATQLAAGAVTAKSLMVYSDGAALNLDPGFADPSAWTLGGAYGAFVALADGQVGTSAFRSVASMSAVYGIDHIPVDPNKTYRLHMWVRRSANANGNLYGIARLWDASLTDIGGDGSFWLYNPAGIVGSITWTEYNYVFGGGTNRTFPANARYMGVGMLLNYGGSAGYYEVQDLRIEEVLPGTLIKDGVITTSKIAAATITAANIAAGTVTGSNIAAQTISGSNLVADTITAAQISAGAIGTDELAANAVTAGKIAAGTITASQIASATITGTQIASQTITATNIAADTITAAQIAAGAVSTSELASSAVTADKIYANTITSSQIAAGTITATQIASATITGTNIAAQTITGSNLVVNTITAGLIAAGAIGTGQLAAGAVTATQIASGTITATLIASATITGTLIAAGTITASNIAADTITAAQIAAGAVSTSELASGAVTAAKIYANTITAAQIAAGTITATQIASATITGTQIASQTITASNIAADSITAGQIASGAISTDELAANAVTAAKIAAGTITANEIAANTITGGKIAAGTITASNIASGAITADMITTGTLNAALITVTNLSANSITAGTIAVARLPGLSTLNSWISSQLTNWWPSLSEWPSGAPSIPSEKLSLNNGDVTAFSAAGSVPFTVDASSAAMTIKFRATYKPQTSQQANVMAGFMRKNTSTLKYEYMDEATCVVSTGSNAIYNTVTSECRIPVGSYTQLVPWLDNISGNTISVRSVYVEILQVSK